MLSAGTGQALHGSDPQCAEAGKEIGNANGINVCKRNAHLAFAVAGPGRLEHGAGQHQDGGISDKTFGEVVGWQRVGMFGVGEVGATAEQRPAFEGVESPDHGAAPVQNLGPFACDPLRQILHAPKRPDLA